MQLQRDALSRQWIALDANAGFPLSRRVIAELPRWLEDLEPGVNPSSLHTLGKKVRLQLRDAHDRVARSLASALGSLEWLSSGSRANARAAEGLRQLTGKPGLRKASAHDSIAKIPSIALLSSETRFADFGWISLLWVHNETGQIHDLAREVAELKLLAPEILIHVDAVQAWGRLDLSPAFELADLVSFSGSKVGALPGVGVLWVSPRIERAWKERVPQVQNEASWLAVASLGLACEDLPSFTSTLEQIRSQRDRVEGFLRESLGEYLEIVGRQTPRVASTSLFLFHRVKERAVADALDFERIRVGTGAACRSGTAEPSPTLLALGYSAELAKTATRLSWGAPLSEEALMHVMTRVKSVAQRAMGR